MADCVQVIDEFGEPVLLFGLPIFVEVVDGDVEQAEKVAEELRGNDNPLRN